VTAVRWRKSSEHSIAAVGADYAVSRATILDLATHTLVDRFSAWFGPNLLDQPRETSRPAELLGIRTSAAEAKALCLEHQARRAGGPA
jgi:hypothetical protein